MHPLYVAAAIAGCVALSEWLVRRTFLRHLGTAMLVIVVGAAASTAGAIPSSGHAVYDGVFTYVAPISIFWLLLRVNLRRVLEAGLPLLGLFLLGSGSPASSTRRRFTRSNSQKIEIGAT